MSDTSILFQPTSLGSLELKNRLAVAPMTRVSATEDGCATQQMAEYYRRYAAGGFAFVIVEACYIDDQHAQGYHFQPGIINAAQAGAWKTVVDAVHAEGAKICMQLVHAGALVQGRNSGYVEGAIAPSAVEPKGEMLDFYRGEGGYPTPREITTDELIAVKDAFVSAAIHAQKTGFDAIEIHGANGYLLDQFWTAYTNQRTDQYGGSARNRIRLDEEILRAVIAGTQGTLPVGLRLSQSKVNDFEYQWVGGEQDAADIFPIIKDAGAAFVHITEHLATDEVFGSGHSLAALAKKYSSLPVIANGGLGDPATAVSVVAGGNADIVAQGKAALANQDWPNKVQSGKALEDFDFGMLGPIANLDNAEIFFANRG
ncbi:MAG: NADH:flavin oxidoreductase [Thermoleophilia bacterium]|nr:NADH:flavin oxidoreductase [Thermoleophilia bacterium]